MQRCISLAKQGAGRVAPNPMVGAVLVHQDKIIGEGYHEIYGSPHAEVKCIDSVTEKDKHLISESRLYVSLEPCVHFGRTPPCTDLIIKNKIPEVIIGCGDPYTEVNGKGIEKLRSNQVNVISGVLEKECIELNKRFFTFHQKKRPYIILKWAQSSDGMIGKLNERILISNEYSDRLVHRWRTEEAGIMVGTNTALSDDPSLTARSWPGKNPVRIVLDTELRLPAHLKLFDGTVSSIVFNYKKNETANNIEYVKISRDQELVPQMMEALNKRQIQSVIMEGGARLLQTFIDAGVWDEARVINNGQLTIGNGIPAPYLGINLATETKHFGSDIIKFFRNQA